MKTANALAGLPFHGNEPALGRFGYNAFESAFLSLAALHGGYFLRRQVAQFLRCRDGGRVTQLVQRALAMEHVQCSTWRQKVQLYHVSARQLYTAIGEANNRNRRRHEWSQIKNRVMGLDFVLARPDVRFLATEREKIAYFAGLHIPFEALPATRYRSHSGESCTARYFIDKYPVSVRDSSDVSTSARVSFTFVDEGLVGLSRFESYLEAYLRLFEVLDSFELIYVATSDAHFSRARSLFERFRNNKRDDISDGDAQSGEQLRAYFRLRQRYEQRAFSAFGRNELIRLRDARERFSDPKHEALFQVWKTTGDALWHENAASSRSGAAPLSGTFATELLRHDYSFFGGYGLR
jgi:hypothetical protein